MTTVNVSTNTQPGREAEQVVQVPCTDVFNRGRAVRLWLSHKSANPKQRRHVVLVAPPGEAARLTAAEARELAKQLVAQAGELEAEQRKLTRQPGTVLRLPAHGQAGRGFLGKVRR